tara:strand:+ start:65 stop:355 length:291 start_codon:yes stop_codon:yes gene_type:complete
MTANEKTQLAELFEKIDTMDKKNIKLFYRVESVLDVLEDDKNSNTKGLISKVNDLDAQVEKLLQMNIAIKRASVFFFSILGGLATWAIKLWWTSES